MDQNSPYFSKCQKNSGFAYFLIFRGSGKGRGKRGSYNAFGRPSAVSRESGDPQKGTRGFYKARRLLPSSMRLARRHTKSRPVQSLSASAGRQCIFARTQRRPPVRETGVAARRACHFFVAGVSFAAGVAAGVFTFTTSTSKMSVELPGMVWLPRSP